MKHFFLKTFILSVIFVGKLAQAQRFQYQPLEPLPTPSGIQINSSDIGAYLQNIIQLIIGIAGVLAVIMIVLGGVQYLSTDAIGGKQDGRKKITNALWGLFLAALAWLILNTINPTLLDIKIGN
ncbi:MAG: pilin [Patescibacteria group bacterium]